MKTSVSKIIKHGILVESDDVKSFFDFLTGKYQTVKLQIQCNDGSLLENMDIQDFLSFENPDYRKIEEILFSALGDDESENLSLIIKKNRTEFRLSSNNDERAVFITQEIMKRLLAMKPNYDWVARFPLLITVMSLYLLFILLSLSFRVINFSIILINIIIWLSATYLLEILKKYLFPKVFFLIGKQKKVMENIQKARTFIFVTVILSLVLGLITNWLSSVVF